MATRTLTHDQGVTGSFAAMELESRVGLESSLDTSWLTEASVSPFDYIRGILTAHLAPSWYDGVLTIPCRVIVEPAHFVSNFERQDSYIQSLVGTRTLPPTSDVAQSASKSIQPTPTETARESFPTRCLNEICSWLDIPKRQLLRALNISPSTYYSWDERGSKPRPSSTSLLYRVHGIVKVVVQRRGIAGAREWFYAGSPRNIDAILGAAQNPDELDRLIKRVYAEFSNRVDFRNEVPAIPGGEAPMIDKTPEGWGS